MTTTELEPRWKAYLRAGIVLLPAVCAWIFCCVFLFPKLQEIWKLSGFSVGLIRDLLRMSLWMTEHGMAIALVAGIVIVLLEWRSPFWHRIRRGCLTTATLVLNATAIALITLFFASALATAPALMAWK